MEESGFDKMSKGQKLGFVRSAAANSYRRRMGKSMPRHLVNVVTWRCNSRCVMCNIWKKKDTKELSLQEFENVFSDPFWSDLRTVNLTGGEPFLRKDIVELVLLMERKLPHLEMVSFSSNGFMPGVIESKVKELLKKKKKTTRVGVTISIDGIGKDHSEIRGIERGFDLAMDTVQRLKPLEKDKTFMLTTETVVFSKNSRKVKELREYLRKRGIHNSMAIVSFQDSYYDNADKKGLALAKKDIAGLFDRKHFIDYSIRKQVREGKRYLPCGVGKTTLTMMPEGDIYFCQFLTKIGNIKERRLKEIWDSPEARKQRKLVEKGDICRNCYFSCDIYSSVESSLGLTVKFGLMQYLLKYGLIKSD